ncbi:MAG TPA: hypothetical protein VFI61_01815 [Patescibacteria group bacterium]|nr:hypothetical protein [Patescibacteria group bacterium]
MFDNLMSFIQDLNFLRGVLTIGVVMMIFEIFEIVSLRLRIKKGEVDPAYRDYYIRGLGLAIIMIGSIMIIAYLWTISNADPTQVPNIQNYIL